MGDAVAGKVKARKMKFCLAEGARRVWRNALMKAVVVRILRDERHGRLLIRFRCADFKADVTTLAAHKRKRNANANANAMQTQPQTQCKRNANAKEPLSPNAMQTQRLSHKRNTNADATAMQTQ